MKRFKQRLSISKRQRGMVLLITLIVLVAMMLASVGIMRSVDTSVAAVSNMAFKQAADEAAGVGMQKVLQDVMPDWAAQLSRNPAFLDTDGGKDGGGGVGYYASIQSGESAQGIPAFLLAQPPANDAGLIRNGPDDAKNMTRTMVERMCNRSGAADGTICLGREGERPNCNQATSKCLSLPGSSNAFMAYYRISVRVDGPNNTVSFAQSFILL